VRWAVGLSFIGMACGMLAPDNLGHEEDVVSISRVGVFGTTMGMLIAEVPAVFLGDNIAQKVSMKPARGIAATTFAAMGLLALFNVGKLF